MFKSFIHTLQDSQTRRGFLLLREACLTYLSITTLLSYYSFDISYLQQERLHNLWGNLHGLICTFLESLDPCSVKEGIVET